MFFGVLKHFTAQAIVLIKLSKPLISQIKTMIYLLTHQIVLSLPLVFLALTFILRKQFVIPEATSLSSSMSFAVILSTKPLPQTRLFTAGDKPALPFKLVAIDHVSRSWLL